MTRRRLWKIGVAVATIAAVAPVGAEEAEPPPTAIARAAEPASDLPYDSAGRRDPFRPPRAGNSAVRTGEARTPLQRYEIGQLRLVAVIYDTREPRAVVEDDQGLGYIVKGGTPIGPNGGLVQSIERGRMVIEEDSVDFYGEHHRTNVVMELRTTERGKQ